MASIKTIKGSPLPNLCDLLLYDLCEWMVKFQSSPILMHFIRYIQHSLTIHLKFCIIYLQFFDVEFYCLYSWFVHWFLNLKWNRVTYVYGLNQISLIQFQMDNWYHFDSKFLNLLGVIKGIAHHISKQQRILGVETI